jgi:hypothetical protein
MCVVILSFVCLFPSLLLGSHALTDLESRHLLEHIVVRRLLQLHVQVLEFVEFLLLLVFKFINFSAE